MQIEVFYDLIANAAEYKKRLEALKEAEAKAKERIEQVAKVGEIEFMHATAKASQAKVAEEIKQARDKIEKEAAEAKVVIQKKWDDLGVKQTTLAKQEKELAEAAAELADLRVAVKEMEKKAKESMRSAEVKEQELKDKEILLNEKLAKLKDLAG